MDSGKIKYIKHIIRNTAGREITHTIQDLILLLQSKDFLSNPEIKQMLCQQLESHLDQLSIENYPKQTRLMCTPPGRVPLQQIQQQIQSHDENLNDQGGDDEQEQQQQQQKAPKPSPSKNQLQYYDQNSNKFQVDTLAMVARKIEDSATATNEQNESVLNFKTAIKGRLKKYLDVKFKEGSGQSYAFVFSNPLCAQIFISAHNESWQNFRVGEWVSQWQVDFDEGSSTFSLKGQIRIHAHYFQEGNLMFKVSKIVEGSGKGSIQDYDGLASNIVQEIFTLEQKYQTSLQSMYEVIQKNFLKAVRRKLAVTGQKFNWQTKLV